MKLNETVQFKINVGQGKDIFEAYSRHRFRLTQGEISHYEKWISSQVFYDILNSEVIGYSYNYDRDINISEKRVIEVVITFKILLFKLQQIRNRFIYNILYANYKEAVKNNDFWYE